MVHLFHKLFSKHISPGLVQDDSSNQTVLWLRNSMVWLRPFVHILTNSFKRVKAELREIK